MLPLGSKSSSTCWTQECNERIDFLSKEKGLNIGESSFSPPFDSTSFFEISIFLLFLKKDKNGRAIQEGRDQLPGGSTSDRPNCVAAFQHIILSTLSTPL